jgi:Mg-chelatase subunit ChlI
MRAQSVLARGLHALLPPIEVVRGSFCNSDPENPREWEARALPALACRTPPLLAELPASVKGCQRAARLVDVRLALRERLWPARHAAGGAGFCEGCSQRRSMSASQVQQSLSQLPNRQAVRNVMASLSRQGAGVHACPQADLRARIGGGEVPREIRDAPFVQVPLGVTEDRLVGTVDIEASMKARRAALSLFLPSISPFHWGDLLPPLAPSLARFNLLRGDLQYCLPQKPCHRNLLPLLLLHFA